MRITITDSEGKEHVLCDTAPGIAAGDLNAALIEVQNEQTIRSLPLKFPKEPALFGQRSAGPLPILRDGPASTELSDCHANNP